MKRLLLSSLKAWSQDPERKPLILLGARQVGKTFLLREFGEAHFAHVHEFNFQSNPSLQKIFADDLTPENLIKALEFVCEKNIDTNGQSLLFFDEIQDCPRALTSLKYFNEQMPNLPIVAAGSLLGLHLSPGSFPVGKVHLMHLFPMSFGEFLEAAASPREFTTFQKALQDPATLSLVAHERFWTLFKCYLITGGLPESISTWISAGGFSAGAKGFTASRDKLTLLIASYFADISKHAGKTNAMHIERIWRNIPQQLASFLDDSTKRYKFKDVVPGINAYRDLVNAIDWLTKSGMALRVPVCHSAQIPISAHTKENIFKLYMFDCGLLTSMLSLGPKIILDFDFGSYKGFIAENFVAQELLAHSPSPIHPLTPHAWSEGQAEIEFLIETENGVVPVEVKSGNKVRAKSLKSFMDRYQPKMSVVLSARPPSVHTTRESKLVNLPLYLTSTIFASNANPANT